MLVLAVFPVATFHVVLDAFAVFLHVGLELGIVSLHVGFGV